mgnify:FL=1
MEIPQELKENIENLIIGGHLKIIEQAQNVSKKYRENTGKGNKIITSNSEAIAYAISRMPATYCAVYLALSQTLKKYKNEIKTVYDIGAGTGSATWAIQELLQPQKITCLEYEKEMLKIGERLMKKTETKASWEQFDITKDCFQEKADLVISSYMLNELEESSRKNAIQKMWEATSELLLLIEPGTPKGFKHILEAREILLQQNANIVAPCTHNGKCEISQDDWCSFYVRVARSGIHRQAKNGTLGYEDEKFSYIAVSREPAFENGQARILRHPQIGQGHVKVKVCTQNGIQEKTFTKKDKEVYKKVRKLDAGECI